jgi:hypothetical protein
MAFDDEFSNESSLNTKEWAPYWFGAGDSLNGSATEPANVSVGGGALTLTLSSSNSGAAVSTNPNGGASSGFQFGCGVFIEGRILFPGSGSTVDDWPAFWTSSQNWPATGETDIFEGLSGNATSNYHSGGASQSGSNIQNLSGPVAGSWAAGWHTYGVDREAGENTIYWDGQVVRSYPTYDNCAPQYLLINIGAGSYGGPVVAPAKVEVSYVRVWNKG